MKNKLTEKEAIDVIDQINKLWSSLPSRFYNDLLLAKFKGIKLSAFMLISVLKGYTRVVNQENGDYRLIFEKATSIPIHYKVFRQNYNGIMNFSDEQKVLKCLKFLSENNQNSYSNSDILSEFKILQIKYYNEILKVLKEK